MLVIVSNRNINDGATDETLFGETANPKGIDELRNEKIRGFFRRVFTGQRGEVVEGFEYDPRVNAYRL